MEGILRRLGFERMNPTYVDAGPLASNTMRSRELAKKAVQRKMEQRKKFSKLLSKSDIAAKLYAEALKLDVNVDDQFLKFVDLTERVLDLLGINEMKRQHA